MTLSWKIINFENEKEQTKSKEIGVCATVNFPRHSGAQVWDSELQAIKPNEATLGESLQIVHNSLETHNG